METSILEIDCACCPDVWCICPVPVDQVTVTGVTASLEKLTVKAGETIPLTLHSMPPFLATLISRLFSLE